MGLLNTSDDASPWKLAWESTGEGVWDLNMITKEQVYSRSWKAMLGFSGDEIGTSSAEFTGRVHPDDLPSMRRVSLAYQNGDTAVNSVELRMRCKDGNWKWILVRIMMIVRDEQSRAVRMIGTHTDISERKKNEFALQELNAQLQEKSHLLQTSLANISQGIFVLDADNRVITFNPRVCELLDLPASFLAAYPTLEEMNRFQFARGDFGQDAMQVAYHARTYVLSGGKGTVPATYMRVTPAGRTLEVKSKVLPEGGMVRTFADISDYVRAETALVENEERWKLALDSTGDGVWDWNISTGEEHFSKRLLEMYGLNEGDILNRSDELDSRTHPDDVAQLQKDRQAHFDGVTATYVNEHRVRCKDGSWKWVLTRGMVISRDAQGKPLRMTGTHTDITERKNAEQLIWQQAHFDALTGLPNRNMLRDRLEQEIKKTKRESQQLAILFIDLDHFKEVNDTLGHASGDLLLVEAAKRIKACVRDMDTVARMGGDEFTVLLTELNDTASLERILQGLLHSLSGAFQLGTEQVFVSASVGVTMYPMDGTQIEDLFKNADQALYVAKGTGRNRFSFFTPALQEAAQTRVRLANDLRSALGDEQFRLVFQPILEIATGSVHKAEALIRWQHPTRGLVSPAAFIPIAEASGLIVDIGEWVFRQAAQQVSIWRTTLDPRFQISVNKSPVQFHHHGTDHEPWINYLGNLGLPGESIVVEITEGLLLDTSTRVTDLLLSMSDAGIQVSLDDFGTGYSSLSYLQKFDIDFLKIDQSFVRHLVPGCTDLALCKAIIVMAHELGMKVIAEGVETHQQFDLLAAAGCDFAQGYLFARPMSAPDFDAFMAARQAPVP
jgi:diguanylate cyclase (GGDEF)-like protein/PAS domain S-box-containing protein